MNSTKFDIKSSKGTSKGSSYLFERLLGSLSSRICWKSISYNYREVEFICHFGLLKEWQINPTHLSVSIKKSVTKGQKSAKL